VKINGHKAVLFVKHLTVLIKLYQLVKNLIEYTFSMMNMYSISELRMNFKIFVELI